MGGPKGNEAPTSIVDLKDNRFIARILYKDPTKDLQSEPFKTKSEAYEWAAAQKDKWHAARKAALQTETAP